MSKIITFIQLVSFIELVLSSNFHKGHLWKGQVFLLNPESCATGIHSGQVNG